MARCPNKNTAEYKALQDVFQTEVRTNNVINNWQDLKNTDTFPTPFEANEMVQNEKISFALKQKEFAYSLLDNLRRERIGHTYQGQFFINNSNPATREFDEMFLDANIKRLYRYLKVNNLSADTITLDKTPMTYRLTVNEDMFTNKDMLESSRSWDTPRAREVVMHLKRMFPQVNVKMLTVGEAADMFANMPDWKKSNVKFADVKSFYVDGVAYLIKGRVTDETAIEEMLHPIIDAIKIDNVELFNNLLAEASINFPQMVQEIKAEYNKDTRNFSDTERDLEIVTQALTRHFNKEYESTPTKGWLDRVKEMADWFIGLINNLNEYLTGRPLSVRDIKADASLSDIAKLLNTEGIQFKLESRVNGKIRFSLSPEKKRQVDQALSEANGVQAEVIKSLFHIASTSDVEVNSLSGGRFKSDLDVERREIGDTIVVLNEADHTYADITDGEIYTSVTTAIKGKLKNMEDVQLNLDLGNDVDALLDAYVTHRSVEDVFSQMKVLDLETAKDVLATLETTMKNIVPENAVVLSQVVVFDKATKLAGTADVVVVLENGEIKIVDLKTTKNSLSSLYRYETKTGTQQVKKYDRDFLLEDESLLKQAGIERLSTRGQHNLQVNLYRRMFQNMGYNVYQGDYAASTFHLVADITGKGKDQKFNGSIKADQWVDHPASQNLPYVNMLVPISSDATQADKLDKLTENMYDSTIEPDVDPLVEPIDDAITEAENVTPRPDQPAYDAIAGVLKEYQIANQNKINLIDARGVVKASIYLDRTKDETIEQLAATNAFINIAISEGPIAQSIAYSELLQDALKQIRSFGAYIQDPRNFNKPEYITYVLNFDKYIKTFKGLYSIEKSGELNATQRSLVLSLQIELNKLTGANDVSGGLVNEAIDSYVKEIIRNKSNRNYGGEGSFFSKEDLDLLMKETEDISGADLKLRDMATQPDVILALMDKIYKSKKQELLDKVSIRKEVIKAAGNKVLKLTPNGTRTNAYNFMLVFDENGEFTGNYVKKTGKQYYDIQDNLGRELTDNEGNPYQYVPITNLDDANPRDIEKNIALADKKAAYGAFFRAERTTDGRLDDGEYHRYTQEFKDIRDKYEYYVPGKDGSEFGNWYRKPRITDVEYSTYQAKYFDRVEYTKAVRVNGRPTGQVILGETFPSPKVQYREALEVSNPVDGVPQDMTSEQYRSIMNPTDALGVAQKEFYELYIQYFEKELLEKLPMNTRMSMMGRIPLVKNNTIEKLKKESTLWNKLYARTVSSNAWNMFNQTSSTKNVIINQDTGFIVDQMPVFYTGRAKVDGDMEQAEKDKQALQDKFKEGNITAGEFKIQIAEINGRLARLRSTPSLGQISTDLATSLIKFSAMAENFETMGTIEDTLLAMKKVIDKRTYNLPESSDISLVDRLKGTLRGTNKTPKGGIDPPTNTKTRAAKFMSMVYYDNENITKGAWDKIAGGIIQLSSLSYVAFNPFGNFNNYMIGRVNNNIELLAGRFVSRQAQIRAAVEFNKRALPDMVSRTGHALKDVTDVLTLGAIPGLKSSEYDPKRANSKYEGFVDGLRMMDKMTELREQGADSSEGKSWFERATEWGYVMQDAAEYNVQTKMGMAVLMDTYLMNEGGDILSFYDAHDFNPETHENELKKGYNKVVKVDKDLKFIPGSAVDYTDQFRYDLRNKIREINKQIHGNYAAEDRMVIQQHTLGKLAVQFKKWVAPAIRARYQREYFDENLGWMEGRYISALKFAGYIKRELVRGNMEFSTYGKGFLKSQVEDFSIKKNRSRGLGSEATEEYGQGGNMDQRAENQLYGFYRTMGEIGIMGSVFLIQMALSAMLEGDDDDTDTQRRFKNLTKYQANRIYKELVLFMPWIPAGGKQVFQQFGSPIAATRTFGEIAELMSIAGLTGLGLVFRDKDKLYADSELVYQRGDRKGELKIYKNFKDVFPIVYSIQKWESYLTNDDFYIK